MLLIVINNRRQWLIVVGYNTRKEWIQIKQEKLQTANIKQVYLIALYHAVDLVLWPQGEKGLLGRPGSTGPTGTGEPGPTVSIEAKSYI